jgi:hypothetical protein
LRRSLLHLTERFRFGPEDVGSELAASQYLQHLDGGGLPGAITPG